MLEQKNGFRAVKNSCKAINNKRQLKQLASRMKQFFLMISLLVLVAKNQCNFVHSFVPHSKTSAHYRATFDISPIRTVLYAYSDDDSSFKVTSRAKKNKKKKAEGKNRQNIERQQRPNTSLSIEELEGQLTERWGTSIDEWVVNLDEEELVYDSDKLRDEDNDDDADITQKHNERTKNVKSKAVLDPWERKAENKKVKVSKKKKKVLESKAVFAMLKSDDASLNRVRRNQERLGSPSKDILGKTKTQTQTQKQNKQNPLKNTKKTDNSYDTGRIRENEVNQDESSRYSDDGGQKEMISKEKDVFFFSDSAAKNKPSIQENKITKNEQRSETIKVKAPVILDENGIEKKLTLVQAQTMAQAHFESMGNEDDSSSSSKLSWNDVGITQPILVENLAKMRCDIPLPVQEKSCPSIVAGNDGLISTHTGSGKTIAFLAPLAQRLLFDVVLAKDYSTNNGVKAIIIAPGRELASQIVAVARELLQGTGHQCLLAIGGTPFNRNLEQIRKRKPTILVGTPGRIAELVCGNSGEKSGRLKIADLQAVVLDECDALLQYRPHRDPTVSVMAMLKKRHKQSLQSVLCSATACDLLAAHKKGEGINLNEFLREGHDHIQADNNDASITAKSDATVRVSRTAIHGVVHVPQQQYALETLRKILYTNPTPQQVLIFVHSPRRVEIVVEKLLQMGIVAAPLHGGMDSDKGERANVNKALREGFVGMVVSTELAARGIDAPYLTHVINLDLPTDASHYAHRAGRCGRGGRPGVVINLAVGNKEKKVPYNHADALNIEMHTIEPRDKDHF